MSNKKRVVLSIILGIFVISSVIIVSAGILDWFKVGDDSDLEGELPASTDVNVNLANAAPTIVAFRAADDLFLYNAFRMARTQSDL